MRRHAKVLIAALALFASLGTSQALAAAPTASIDPVAGATFTTAQVSGTIDPKDNDSYYSFEYSADPASEGWSGFSSQGPVAANSGPQSLSTQLTGLKPGTAYKVRLTANNSVDPEAFSAEASFTTLALPVLDPVSLSGLSAHFSASLAPKGSSVEYHFELAEDNGGAPKWASFGSGSSESATPITIGADHALAADTKYLARVVATVNGDTVDSSSQSFATGTLPPTVQAIPGSGRTATSVRLNGTVNPNGLPTTYRFEYGTDTSYGTVIPATGPDLYGGTGSSMVRYSKLIEGLAPNTTIHYRVIAHNADGTSVSGDQTVVSLAQEWGYEMVSPPEKEGSNILPAFQVSTTANGDRAVFTSAGVFAGGVSALLNSQYMSIRGDTNWRTMFLPLPHTTRNENTTRVQSTRGLSPDLSHVILFSNLALEPGAVAGNSNMYYKNLDTGQLEFVATFTDPGFAMSTVLEVLVGASQDGERLFLSLPGSLAPGAPAGESIYEFSHGTLTLISRLPDGSPVEAGPGLGGSGVRPKELNQVSRDASRVFFTPSGRLGLYVRENGASTRLISASQRTGADPEAAVETQRVWASADGSTVYFTTPVGEGSEPLTDDAPTWSGSAGTDQLYKYDLESGKLEYIPPQAPSGPTDSNLVTSILGVSADGSTVYFSAAHSTGEENPFVYPSNRIYANRDGVTRFIRESDVKVEPYIQYGAVSPNGDHLAFEAKGVSFPEVATNSCANCSQVYEYDYDRDKLSCASCNPTGVPTGMATLPNGEREGLGGAVSRTMLSDGTVFFESSDQLLPEDTNEKQDVYRWADGQLDLVSSGRSSEDSFFGDASVDGESVFFITAQRLVSQDVDGIRDVYVKREGGGLPEQNRPQGDAPCFGEGCLNKSPDPPGEVTPASNGFSGPANPKPSFRKTRKCIKARHGKAKSSKARARCAKRSTHKANGGGK